MLYVTYLQPTYIFVQSQPCLKLWMNEWIDIYQILTFHICTLVSYSGLQHLLFQASSKEYYEIDIVVGYWFVRLDHQSITHTSLYVYGS